MTFTDTPALRSSEMSGVGACHGRRDGAPLTEVGAARMVLLDKPGVPAHEHSRERTRITKWLICEHAFTAVVIEGDRDGASRGGGGRSRTFEQTPLPAWAWDDEELLDLLRWLRTHNDGLHRTARKVTCLCVDPATLMTDHLAGRDQRTVVWTREAQITDLRWSRTDAPNVSLTV